MSNRAEEAGRLDHREIQLGQAATYLLAGEKLGSNLGPNAAKLGPKPGTTTQNKAKRTNEIDFISRLCKQGVTGSIPVTSTNFFLIAKDLEKPSRPQRSVIRAHCARTVRECVIGAPLCTMAWPKIHRPRLLTPSRSLDG